MAEELKFGIPYHYFLQENTICAGIEIVRTPNKDIPFSIIDTYPHVH